MGSLCGESNTTTQKSTSTPTGAPQMMDIWNRVQQAASTPYTPYGGQMVANLSPTQQAGIQGITNAQGSAQPYFDQAAQDATAGAAPISQADIQRNMSPYTQNVIDATRANFQQDNKIQQGQITGNAAAKGALGGDRVAVAQGEAARQQRMAQDPVIAGMYSSAYDKAMGAAQQDRAAQAQGAYTFGALAPSVQNAQISGSQAQIGAGGLEQGTEQAKLTAGYNQYLQQQAFPYQQAGFMASAGLPAVGAMGGTTNSTTTAPPPSLFGQIAGLGIAGLGAAGGIPGVSSMFGGGFGGGTPTGFTGNTTNPFSGYSGATTSYMGGIPYPMFAASGGRIERKSGGRINHRLSRFHDTVHAIRQTLRGGGAVRGGGYAGGGTIDLSPNDYVSHGFGDAREAVESGAFDPQGGNALSPIAFSPPTVPDVPMPRPRPMDAPQTPFALPPQITQGADGDGLPDDAMAFAGPQRSPYAMPPQPAAVQPVPTAAPVEGPGPTGGGPLGLSEDARTSLISAGLGMMASKSPFALSAIGEGGLTGVKTYEHRRDARQKVESEAKRLAQTASQFAQNLDLHKDQLASTDRRHGETLAETQHYHSGLLERENNKFIGTNEEGFPVYKDTRTGKETIGETKLQGKSPAGYVRNPDGTMAPIKGGPADPEHLAAVAKAKSTGGVLPDDTAGFLADRILAGDNKALTNLGRGAQGAENVIKVQTMVAQRAAQRGMDPSDILAKVAEQSGLSASQRTFGTQTAKMAVNATEAEGAIDLGVKASEAVPRTNWVPVNKAIQAYQSGTSDPALAKFGAANLAIINTYARAINPNGVGTVHDKEHAEKMLSTAMGQPAYLAVLEQMRAEIDIAHKAAPKAKQELERLRKTPAAAGAAEAAAPKIGDRKQFKGPDGNPVWGTFNGTAWAPEKP